MTYLRIQNSESKSMIEELFYALTSFLVVLTVLELAFPRMVLSYLNLNILLLAWLIIAIILLWSRKKATK